MKLDGNRLKCRIWFPLLEEETGPPHFLAQAVLAAAAMGEEAGEEARPCRVVTEKSHGGEIYLWNIWDIKLEIPYG